MRFASFLVITLALGCSTFAQSSLNINPNTVCSWNEDAIIPGDLRRFPPDKETRAAVDKIMKYTGLKVNFELIAANVPTALAAMDGNSRVILYSQSFMSGLAKETGTDWAGISILAHEIGHHLSLHTFGVGGNRAEQELAADQFSGDILFKMGATMEQAKAAMESRPETRVPYYPKKSARLAAIANGWMTAKDLVPIPPNPIVTPVSPITPPKISGVSGTWSGEYTLLPDKGSQPTYIVFHLTQEGATIEGEMTLTNYAATNGQTEKLRGTYQENGDLDMTTLSRRPMHFHGNLPPGANSLSGKVVSVDTTLGPKAEKKLTFPGTFSITRSPE
jgi:hypothetical protein